MDNYKNNEFFFIITEISDLQVLEKEFGKIVLESKNIRLDTGNHITFAFYSIYPQVFKFKNGRLTEHLQVDSKRVSLWDSLKKTHDPSL